MSDVDKPHFANIADFHIDADYVAWFSDIKQRYNNAQIKAAIKVNAEKMAFNWSLGRDLVFRKVEERWGNGVVEQLSFDLQEAFPKAKGFSSVNLWWMKRWYLFFSSPESNKKLYQLGKEIQHTNCQKLHQLGAELQHSKFQSIPVSTQSMGEPGVETELPYVLGLVPWRHQTEIISKCKSIDPTIGLLICSDKDETDVRWAFKGVETPLGIASYDNVQVKPSEFLPSADELQTRIRLLEKELNIRKNEEDTDY